MKKQFLNLGKALTKAEQKSINGGAKQYLKCNIDEDCTGVTECCDTHSGSCYSHDETNGNCAMV